jgi:hypothetical protein
MIGGSIVLAGAGFGAGYLVFGDGGSSIETSAKESSSPPPSVSPSPSPVPSPSPSPPAAAVPQDWSVCTNSVKRFSIGYPGGWVTHHVKAEDACNLFDPESFTYVEDSEGPSVAMTAFLYTENVDQIVKISSDDQARKVIKMTNTQVGGRRSVLIELEATGSGIEEKGTKIYEYFIDRDGRAFSVGTHVEPKRAQRYAEFQAVIDQAAKALKFY